MLVMWAGIAAAGIAEAQTVNVHNEITSLREYRKAADRNRRVDH